MTKFFLLLGQIVFLEIRYHVYQVQKLTYKFYYYRVTRFSCVQNKVNMKGKEEVSDKYDGCFIKTNLKIRGSFYGKTRTNFNVHWYTLRNRLLYTRIHGSSSKFSVTYYYFSRVERKEDGLTSRWRSTSTKQSDS